MMLKSVINLTKVNTRSRSLLQAAKASICTRPMLISGQQRMPNILIPVAYRTAITPLPMTDAKEQQKIASRKISTKLLCDVSGTRYYESNEEIEFAAS